MLAEAFNEKHLKDISGCPSIRASLFAHAKLPLFCRGFLVRREVISPRVGGKTAKFAANKSYLRV